MNGSDIEQIYRRYVDGLSMVGHGSISIDAAKLALGLALHEVLDRMPQQTGMLGNWLSANGEHIVDNPVETAISIIKRDTAVIAQLRQQLADNARLINELAQPTPPSPELERCEDDNAALTARIVELEEQLSAATAAGHAALAQVAMKKELDWSSLSPVAHDYKIGLDSGRWRFRDIPKQIRLELVRCVIGNLPAPASQSAFDQARPEWMSTATAHVLSFNVSWSQLCDLAQEIVVGK